MIQNFFSDLVMTCAKRWAPRFCVFFSIFDNKDLDSIFTCLVEESRPCVWNQLRLLVGVLLEVQRDPIGLLHPVDCEQLRLSAALLGHRDVAEPIRAPAR